MEKGILTKTVEDKLGQKLDDLIKLKGVWEAIDGIAFRLSIKGIDDIFADKIRDDYQEEIQDLITEIIDEQDYNDAVTKGFEFVDSLVDIPGIDDPTEAMLFKGMAEIVIAVLLLIKKDE